MSQALLYRRERTHDDYAYLLLPLSGRLLPLLSL